MGIPPKQKPCKGTGVTSGLGCGIETYHRKLGLGLMCGCYSDFLLKTEPGKLIMQKAMLKGSGIVKKDIVKKEKAVRDKMKENVKTLSQYEAEAKKSFQKWVRMRDAGKNCISCDKPTNDPAGGHFYSAGTYSGLMFNPDNCHLQCNTNCNKHLSGNLLEYRKGLLKRYGNEFVDNLDNLSIELRNYKYTKIELQEIKQKYDAKIKNNDFNA